MGTLQLIILATVIGLFNHSNKPAQYKLTMEDGSQTKVVLQKNSSYACPLYCEIEHIHYAVVCENALQINNNKSVYHISEIIENYPGIFCSTKKILSMSRLKPVSAKEKLHKR